MIVYKCVFANDEVGSDSYPTTVLHEVVIQLEGRVRVA